MEERVPFEELDLTVKAYNTLKLAGVQYIDEVQAVIDTLEQGSARTRELTARLRGWQCYVLAIAKVEAALDLLEELMRADQWHHLSSFEQDAIAETAEAMRVGVARLRDHEKDRWKRRRFHPLFHPEP
jgi:RNA polymerase-interacting CarD/CdnL/TRCF family regulator